MIDLREQTQASLHEHILLLQIGDLLLKLIHHAQDSDNLLVVFLDELLLVEALQILVPLMTAVAIEEAPVINVVQHRELVTVRSDSVNPIVHFLFAIVTGDFLELLLLLDQFLGELLHASLRLLRVVSFQELHHERV